MFGHEIQQNFGVIGDSWSNFVGGSYQFDLLTTEIDGSP